MRRDFALLKKKRRETRQASGVKTVYARVPTISEKSARGDDISNDSLLFNGIRNLCNFCHFFYVMNSDYMRAFDNRNCY